MRSSSDRGVMDRVYLDYNATAPLRPEAREAMIQAMALLGNPSSVHAEGRMAKGFLESCRARIAEHLGASSHDLIFTSGATEAAAFLCSGRELEGAPIEHDAVRGWIDDSLGLGPGGAVNVDAPERTALQLANSETGVVQELPEGLAVSDLTQGIGRLPFAFSWSGIDAGFLSAHKLGGPKGVGVALLRPNIDVPAHIKGGGQEMGRRSGTENLIGIAGFSAALSAAMADLEKGVWDQVAKLRNILEETIEAGAPETIFVARGSNRLPNTSCFITPDWKGETQVMAMDLAGFSISAGSACSSGKVASSQVLRALGFDTQEAGSAVRVSLGPTTTEAEVSAFAAAWLAAYHKRKARLTA